MKGQLSFEFLFVLAVYTVFIFILVSALHYSNFIEKIEEKEFILKFNSLKLIESQRLINNRYTDMRIYIEDCIISEGKDNRTIICRKLNRTHISNLPVKDFTTLLVQYKPLS